MSLVVMVISMGLSVRPIMVAHTVAYLSPSLTDTVSEVGATRTTAHEWVAESDQNTIIELVVIKEQLNG